MPNVPFNANAQAVLVSVTATASSSTALPVAGSSLRASNTGAKHCYIAVGAGAQTATIPAVTAAATTTPVLSGSSVVLSIPSDSVQNFSAICVTGDTTTLVLQVGEGRAV